MKIAIIGTGYVGLVTGACMARLGHTVAAFDNNAEKRALLNSGAVPIFEPGLAELVAAGIKDGNLTFPETAAETIDDADAVFLAVGTPPDANGRADLSAVYAAAAMVAQACCKPTLLVCKSTVPVGTNRAIQRWLASDYPAAPVTIGSNPEFLREGNAIADFMHPDRLVFGADDPRDHAVLRAIYAPIIEGGPPVLETDLETAELVKYAANAFLATKITFINEVADLCEQVGANVADVARGIGLDRRIGPDFLKPGPGYGGSCFPKDAVALANTAADVNVTLRVLDAVISANTARKAAMAERIAAILGGSVAGKRIAILGVAFKANTDDMREAPALDILPALQAAGAAIVAHDPKAMAEAARLMPTVGWAASPYAAARHADAVVVLTEWDAYRELDFGRLRAAMAAPVVIDLRNILPADAVVAAGLAYHGIGRGRPAQDGRIQQRARRHVGN